MKMPIYMPIYNPICRISHDNDQDHDYEDEPSWDVDEDEALRDVKNDQAPWYVDKDEAFRNVDNEDEASVVDNDSDDEGDESLWDHDKDSDSDDVQTSLPPPAPNILTNSSRLHEVWFSTYQQKAEVSIAQKPVHRRRAPQTKLKGNNSKQATTEETPLRDGRAKHCFVKSEQRKNLKFYVFKL